MSTAHHPIEFTDYVDQRQFRQTDNAGLRSVVSYSLKEGVNKEVKQWAFEFYNGVAHQLMTDLMVFEYAHMLKRVLRQTRETILNGVTHPIKNSVDRAKSGVETLWTKLDDAYDNHINGIPVKYDELLSAAIKAKMNTRAASNRMSLIHFSATLFEHADKLDSINLKAVENVRLKQNGIAVGELINAQALIAASKRDVEKGVELNATPKLTKLFLANRFEDTILDSYSKKETFVIETIFDEILENVATHGLANENNKVPVRLEVQEGINGWELTFANQINPSRKTMCAVKSPQNEEPRFEKVAPQNTTGQALVSQMLEMLSIGEIYTRKICVEDSLHENKLTPEYQVKLILSHTWSEM